MRTLTTAADWIGSGLVAFYCTMYILAPIVRPFVPEHVLAKGRNR